LLKQWLTVLAAVLCLLSGIVGAAAKPVQVWSIFSVEQTRIIQELTDAIFTPNTGIHVEITAIPSSGYEQKYLLAAISNEMPEVAVSGSLGPADMGIRGAVVDLRARYGEDYEKVHQSMYPGLMRSFDFLGSAFGLPTQTNIYPMIVRTDIMNELGLQVPSTWNELYEILPKLQSQGKNFATTFGIGTSVYADASMFIWQRGVDLYTPDRQRSALDTPEAIAAFTEFTELFTKHKIPKEINAYMDFTTGAIPIMLTSVWNYSALVQGAPDLEGKWTLSLVPGTVSADGATNHAAYIGGNSLMLFKNASRADDGWEWMKWFVSRETQIALAQLTPQRISGSMFLPSNHEAMMHVPFPEEHVEVFMEQAHQSVAPVFALIPASVIHRLFNFATNKAVLQGVDPEVAIREAADEMNSELARKQKEFERFISKL
jgi:ABC-type glycerol-3-phosphate transport system substrate-binding protein